MVLRSKHICGFNTFFRPHQREFAIERGMVTLWLDLCLCRSVRDHHQTSIKSINIIKTIPCNFVQNFCSISFSQNVEKVLSNITRIGESAMICPSRTRTHTRTPHTHTHHTHTHTHTIGSIPPIRFAPSRSTVRETW